MENLILFMAELAHGKHSLQNARKRAAKLLPGLLEQIPEDQRHELEATVAQLAAEAPEREQEEREARQVAKAKAILERHRRKEVRKKGGHHA